MGEALKDDPLAGFNVVYTYTRAQAIKDGVLVDLSNSYPAEVGRMFKWNLCVTEAVWNLIESAAEADDTDVSDYVYDVSFMAGMAIKTLQVADKSQLIFKVCLPLRGRGTEKQLKLVCSPGDNAEPVLTILLPDED
jgi:hypothetical protein